MKTLKEVQIEVDKIEGMSYAETKDMRPIEMRRLQRKLELLNVFKKYLETNPTEDFIQKEIYRLDKIISNKLGEFPMELYEEKNLPKKEISKLRKKHETMYDIPHMRDQLRALRQLI